MNTSLNFEQKTRTIHQKNKSSPKSKICGKKKIVFQNFLCYFICFDLNLPQFFQLYAPIKNTIFHVIL